MGKLIGKNLKRSIIILTIIFLSSLPLIVVKIKEIENQKLGNMNQELYRAIRMENYEMVALLLKQNIDITLKDQEGRDGLFYTVAYPNEYIFELILGHNPDYTTIYENGKNILHVAIQSNLEERGHYRIIETLVKKGVNVNHQDKFGNPPLWYACIPYLAFKKTIKLLIENNADIFTKNNAGLSVHSHALQHNRVDLLKLLDTIKSE